MAAKKSNTSTKSTTKKTTTKTKKKYPRKTVVVYNSKGQATKQISYLK